MTIALQFIKHLGFFPNLILELLFFIELLPLFCTTLKPMNCVPPEQRITSEYMGQITNKQARRF